MKRAITILLLTIAATAGAQDMLREIWARRGAVATSGPVVTDGLIGYWLFNGNGTDSFSTNNATLYGSPIATNGVAGNPSTALYLNGSSQWISNSIPLIPPTGSFTFSTWVKPAGAFSAEREIMAQWASGNAARFGLYGITTDKINFSYGGASQLASTNTVVAGNWSHVTLTRSGNVFKLYINGVPDTEVVRAHTLLQVNTSVGCYGFGVGGFFAGAIDMMRVYNRAISASEIAEIYNSESTK